MSLFLVFIIGSLLGSFLNVLIDRLSTGRTFITGRSYCESCKKNLEILDLIPLLSYLILKGKCRYCKAKIPFRLFLVEISSGVIGMFVFNLFLEGHLSIYSALFLFVILYSFLGIFVADIVYGIIPDLLVVSSLVASFFYIFLQNYSLGSHLITAFGSLFFFLFLSLVTKGKGMGMGDVKLSFVLGLLLGFPSIIACLYLAFLTGATISIILVLWKKLRFFGGTIPFGPFLVVSSVISLFYGQNIVSYFLQRFL